MTTETLDGSPGVGMVNHDGDLVMFIGCSPLGFSYFSVDQSDIVLSGFNVDPHRRTYGKMTVDAAKKLRSVVVMQVDDRGRPVEMKKLVKSRRSR